MIDWGDRVWVARFDAAEGDDGHGWAFHLIRQLLRELWCRVRGHDTEVTDIEGANMVWCNTCWGRLDY